jgi:hypothetical protein
MYPPNGGLPPDVIRVVVVFLIIVPYYLGGLVLIGSLSGIDVCRVEPG